PKLLLRRRASDGNCSCSRLTAKPISMPPLKRSSARKPTPSISRLTRSSMTTRQSAISQRCRSGTKFPGSSFNGHFPPAGGLTSYGESYAEGFRHAGALVARILKGERPGDIPFDESTKVELIINRKTAETLGVAVPQSFLNRVSGVIE